MISFDEQETTINLVPKRISKVAEIYSCEPAFMNRIRKIARERPDEVTLHDLGDQIFVELPRDWCRVTPKRKVTMTPERLEECMKHLKKE